MYVCSYVFVYIRKPKKKSCMKEWEKWEIWHVIRSEMVMGWRSGQPMWTMKWTPLKTTSLEKISNSSYFIQPNTSRSSTHIIQPQNNQNKLIFFFFIFFKKANILLLTMIIDILSICNFLVGPSFSVFMYVCIYVSMPFSWDKKLL